VVRQEAMRSGLRRQSSTFTLVASLAACVNSGRISHDTVPKENPAVAHAAGTLLAVLDWETRFRTAAGSAPPPTYCLALRSPDAKVGELGSDPPLAVIAAVTRRYPSAIALSACQGTRRTTAPSTLSEPNQVVRVVWAPTTYDSLPGAKYVAGIINIRAHLAFSLSGSDYTCELLPVAGQVRCDLGSVWNT